jgi:hypothetical protein
VLTEDWRRKVSATMRPKTKEIFGVLFILLVTGGALVYLFSLPAKQHSAFLTFALAIGSFLVGIMGRVGVNVIL